MGSFYVRLFGVVYVTRGDFRDGSEKGTENVHFILCQPWEKCYGNPQNDLTRLRGPSLRRTQVFQRHTRFKTGRTSVDDDEHTGRHTSCTTPVTVARIQEFIRQDRRPTIRDIAEEVEVGYGTCQLVLRKNWACILSQPNLCPGS